MQSGWSINGISMIIDITKDAEVHFLKIHFFSEGHPMSADEHFLKNYCF